MKIIKERFSKLIANKRIRNLLDELNQIIDTDASKLNLEEQRFFLDEENKIINATYNIDHENMIKVLSQRGMLESTNRMTAEIALFHKKQEARARANARKLDYAIKLKNDLIEKKERFIKLEFQYFYHNLLLIIAFMGGGIGWDFVKFCGTKILGFI